uniref:DUF3444 domain-containing protein n=1 Tax=Ananas comosus var. bracteatus TaxID=296719 RepID=A0A6V7PJN4_ANACO|nr:unnamed protein product [Ananas comosus var. bracteatus]
MAESGRDPAAAEALRLLAMAEARLASASSLKSALKYAKRAARLRPGVGGAAALVAALRVLRADPSDHYGVLRLAPLSSAAAIRRRYKTLALDLHPIARPSPPPPPPLRGGGGRGGVQARRRVLPRPLRPVPQAPPRPSPPPRPTIAAAGGGGGARRHVLDRLRRVPPPHEFHRRYVGYRLVCPSCRKSFLAVEVPTPTATTMTMTKPRMRNRRKEKKKQKKMATTMPMIIKTRTNPEKTLAEMQMELSREKKRKKRKGNVKPLLQPKEEEENDSSLMVVEDSDFYDFDKDRSEKSFRKGQIWAIYDDDDGMPRHYGLIEEVVSSDPFRIRMSWLDIENHGDEHLLLLEKSGFISRVGDLRLEEKSKSAQSISSPI